ALGRLAASDARATIDNATALLDRAADPARGPVAKRREMVRQAAKQLARLDDAQLTASVPEGAAPLARSLHLDGLALLRSIGAGQLKLGDRALDALTEVLGANPHGSVEVAGLVASMPEAGAMIDRLARMYPARGRDDAAKVRAALSRDLAVGDLETKTADALRERGVSPKDVDAFMGAFAEVRGAFLQGAKDGDDFQRTNWVHTRIEVLHTLEIAKALNLSADQTLVAALGSLASDAFKDSSVHSLLTHNRAGAELVLPLVMGRHFDLSSARGQKLLGDAMRVAHEHQITPPLFMSGAMKSFLAGAPEAVVNEVFTHVNAPLAAPAKDGEITFSREAQEVLAKRGVPGWAVPMPGSDHAGATEAAIVGDVWQYVSPDGVLKIAVDIRDPQQPAPFMRDELLTKAVGSSVGFSFAQGMSVVKDERVQAFMKDRQAELGAMLDAPGGVYAKVEDTLRAKLGVPAGAPTPAIPYWNAPVPTDGKLTAAEADSVKLVKQTFQRALADAGRVPLDPFAADGHGIGGAR
ncbi:hypothetical protein L6R52_42290, partial [Myxococcota bacterium]|nr:hypothetical protein [Myxococcota bacterium]